MRVTNLNTERIRRYLDSMEAQGLIAAKRSGRFLKYSISKKGLRWLKWYKQGSTRAESQG